jgi:hypothetical protein
MTTHRPPDPPPLTERLSRLSHEAAVHAGHVDADPDCRWCAVAAATSSALARIKDSLASVEANLDLFDELWLGLAELGAAHIRDGSRPGNGGEDDRDRRR